jgi:hypothetical protein
MSIGARKGAGVSVILSCNFIYRLLTLLQRRAEGSQSAKVSGKEGWRGHRIAHRQTLPRPLRNEGGQGIATSFTLTDLADLRLASAATIIALANIMTMSDQKAGFLPS